jgi:fumarate reductase flavoprotein subunit
MFKYYMILNQYKLNAGLIRRLCDESPIALEWLISLGVNFAPENLYPAGLDGSRRGHRATDMGQGIVEVLDAHTHAHPSIDVALGSRVERLLLSEAGCAGVVANGDEVTAPAVVVTTGGFGANPEMVVRYLPDTAVYGDWLWYVGSPYCRGDGLTMGVDAGAEVIGLNSVTPILTPGFSRDFEPYIPGWFMLVGHDGQRFADETVEYSVSGALVRDLPGGECFAIFDEAARLGTYAKKSKGGASHSTPSWDADRLEAMAGQGRVHRSDALETLAQAVGINPIRLSATVETYNRDCDDCVDRAFFKDPSLMQPVRESPFYAVRIRPAVIGITGAGLRVDPEVRVLGESGRPLEGLYAAGETVGGVLGRCYIGGGGSLLNAFAFGRVAGMNAARHARVSGGD